MADNITMANVSPVLRNEYRIYRLAIKHMIISGN